VHLTDIILLPRYIASLLFLPVFWVFSENRGALFRRLARIFGCTVAALVLLASANWIIGLSGPAPGLFGGFSPLINFASLLASTIACLSESAVSVRAFVERNFIGVFGPPFFCAFIMLVGPGCRNIDIALHEGRTTATVLPAEHHPRRGITYSYQVEGQSYSGGGDPGNPPYPPGSTFEIRYSTLHPSFSTARNPFEFVGIMCAGSGFALAVSFIARNSRRTPKPSSPASR